MLQTFWFPSLPLPVNIAFFHCLESGNAFVYLLSLNVNILKGRRKKNEERKREEKEKRNKKN